MMLNNNGQPWVNVQGRVSLEIHLRKGLHVARLAIVTFDELQLGHFDESRCMFYSCDSGERVFELKSLSLSH